eukprot:scaffold17207_cov119-Isochrysis_galbana.AAC.2
MAGTEHRGVAQWGIGRGRGGAASSGAEVSAGSEQVAAGVRYYGTRVWSGAGVSAGGDAGAAKTAAAARPRRLWGRRSRVRSAGLASKPRDQTEPGAKGGWGRGRVGATAGKAGAGRKGGSDHICASERAQSRVSVEWDRTGQRLGYERRVKGWGSA